MNRIHAAFGKIIGLHTEPVVLREPFEDFAERFADLPGTVILLSGGDLDSARYHIMGVRPWLTFSAGPRNSRVYNTDVALAFEGNPLSALKRILNACMPATACIPQEHRLVPIASGLMGYVSYDAKDFIEKLPRTCIDRSGLPSILLFAPSILVVHDKQEKTTRLFMPQTDRTTPNSFDENLDFFHRRKSCTRESDARRVFARGLTSNCKRENYLEAVGKVKEYIASGDVYQVNLSQRFEADVSGDPYVLFKTYYAMNPAPFYAYIHAGDHHVVSTSPERFILRRKNRIETRPIKGTRPRGRTPAEDQRLRSELFGSKKDDAELSMIVDLLRNDIGKVCTAGSVNVAAHKRIEAYQNVYHLVSVVEGKLDSAVDAVDIIRAVFPGGSITGCPKIRAMEIIDELETAVRHVYTGAIGYISFHETMDLSIAIRTAVIQNGKMVFSVGGGIVFDSDPEDEFEETLHKGRTLMTVLDAENPVPNRSETAWLNGALVGLDQACIPISEPGFQYGLGFFETIRAVCGKAQNLSSHIERFNAAWRRFLPGEPPDPTWSDIIRQVLFANHLENTTAAVKIIAAGGARENPPFTHTLAVTAKAYRHRLEGKKDPGIHLVTYPHRRHTPLADFKTLNYLFYFQAGKWADAQGGDEALILNCDGTVSETNTANLMVIEHCRVILPASPHVLPGTQQKIVCDFLSDRGYTIEHRAIVPEHLFSGDDVLVTNALIGAAPVLSVDRKKLAPPTDLWKDINHHLL
ncbi:MAG: aminodeoxychorismate synthase component I [Desulfobacterales bacterium]